MSVSVLVITNETTTCFIQKEDDWLSFLKTSIEEYLVKKFIADKPTFLSFCASATSVKDLEVLVEKFVSPYFKYSWCITPATLPEQSPIEILEVIEHEVHVSEPLPLPEITDPFKKLEELTRQIEALQMLLKVDNICLS